MSRSAYEIAQHSIISLTIVGLSAVIPVSQAGVVEQTCKIPPADQILADVQATHTQDTSSKLYTYTFDISSRSTSKQDVWSVTVETTGRITDVRTPRGWFFDVFVDRPLAAWSVGKSVPIEFLKPGQRQQFALISPDPPGSGWMYLEGFAPVATSACENLLETNPALFDVTVNSVRVRVTVPHGFKPLRVNISPTRIDLARPGDVLRVAAFGDRNVPPLLNVNKDTWGLGPAGAAEIHGTVHPDDFNGDGVEDVELHFSVGALGVRRGDTLMCLFGRADSQWLRGCATVTVP